MQEQFLLANGRREGGIIPRDFWGLLFTPFIIGIMTVSYIEGLSRVIVIYGFSLSALYMLHFLYRRAELQPEVLIYFIWISWSLGGLVNVIDRDLYLRQMLTIIQVGVLIFTVSGVAALRKDISFVMLALAVGGIVLAGSSMATGEYHRAAHGLTATRSEGLTGNANEFGYCLLFVVFSGFFFWKRQPSLLWKTLLSGVMAFAVVFIIASGSRKMFLGVLIFCFLWWFFCKEKKLSRNMIWGYLLVVLLLGGIFAGTEYVLSKTNLGQRFGQMDEASNHTRIQMYEEGLEMIKKNPMFGVGLNNYKVLSSSGLYSHSDYIEVATNTGIFGAILYFSIYFVLWRRLSRLKVLTSDPEVRYNIGLLRATIITLLLIALGRVNISSKLTWVFLASIIGYSWSLERSFKKEIPPGYERYNVRVTRKVEGVPINVSAEPGADKSKDLSGS